MNPGGSRVSALNPATGIMYSLECKCQAARDLACLTPCCSSRLTPTRYSINVFRMNEKVPRVEPVGRLLLGMHSSSTGGTKEAQSGATPLRSPRVWRGQNHCPSLIRLIKRPLALPGREPLPSSPRAWQGSAQKGPGSRETVPREGRDRATCRPLARQRPVSTS